MNVFGWCGAILAGLCAVICFGNSDLEPGARMVMGLVFGVAVAVVIDVILLTVGGK